MTRRTSRATGVPWLLGVMIAALLVGGITTVLTSADAPVRPFRRSVETVTSIHTVVVLPEGQAEVRGTVSAFTGIEVNGPVLAMPIDAATGHATIEGAIIDGHASTIVWDGGRPLHLSGSGGLDLGPTTVELRGTSLLWSIEGVRVFTPGTYRITTPVAVGSGGLAHPADSVTFTATDETTIDAQGVAPIARPVGALHLTGPGALRADGTFTVRRREGTTSSTHLEFGPGPLLFDLAPGGAVTAVLNGPLTS